MIRKAIISDIQYLTKLEKDLFQDDAWTYSDFEEQITQNPYASIYVYQFEKKIIGYIDLWIAYENAEIANIGVDKNYQRKGIASDLLSFCMEKVNTARCDNITLEVRISNFSAISLYEKFGFKKVSIRKNYYADGENAYLMVKH